MAKKKDSLLLTYTGIIVTATESDTFILDELMRKFQSAKRYSRERIFEGVNRKETVNRSKPLFLNNSRYMRDAFLEAEASITSQQELLPTYVHQNENKIEKLTKQIERLSKSNKKNKIEKLKSKKAKLKKIKKQTTYYQHHIDNGTVPKIIDGSKQLFRNLTHKKITKEEWRDKRSNAIYSRGEKSKGGNENIKLTYLGENLFEIQILNPLNKKKGDRISFTVRFPDKFVFTIASYLETKEAYSVRVLRENGKYEVHLSLEEENTCTPNFEKGIAGLDMNPDNLSVTIVHPNGNFRDSKVFWLHDVNTVSADKRDWMIQNMVLEVLNWIKSFDVDTLSIEELKFLQQSKSSSFNRMASNFSFSSMTKALISACFKESIALVQVKPYYSSFIGKIKYQQTYGLSIHQSAAFVLARRGMGYEEKIPKEVMSVLFAKEAEKGQALSDLFKHWKVVKGWYDDLLKKMTKLMNMKNGLLEDFFIYDVVCNDKLDFPF